MAKSKALTFGHNSKVAIGGASYFCVQESLKATTDMKEPSEEGMIGTDRPGNTGRLPHKIDVKGNLTVRCTVAELEVLLALWFDQSGGTTTPADSPVGKTANVVIDRAGKVKTYAACWLNAIELSAQENEPIDVLLELLGTTEAVSGTVADVTPPDRMRFSDLAVSLASNAYYPSGFKWRFSYELEERFLNSLVRSVVQQKIPKAEIDLTLDRNSDTVADLFELAGTDAELANCNLTIADGTHTLALAHANCCVINPSADQDGAGVGARKDTVKLRSFLKAPATDIFTGTYT